MEKEATDRPDIDILEWRARIETALQTHHQRQIIAVDTFRHRFTTASQPVILVSRDGTEWVVKGQQNGKMIVNEQIVAHLGFRLGAPIPPVGLIDVPLVLITNCPDMHHMQSGVSHGSQFISDCTQRIDAIDHIDNNKMRFASLHVLYSWIHTNDRQYIYSNQAPNEVYSVDHGHFFPNGPNWTIDSLSKAGPPAFCPEYSVFNLKPEDYRDTLTRLGKITDEDIVQIVAQPPVEWACSIDEKATLAAYIYKRIPPVLSLFNEGSQQ